MPKKKGGQKKNTICEKRTITHADLEGQVYGIVEKALGNRFFTVKCLDNKSRRCKVRKKRMKVKVGDCIIVSLRDFDDNNGDIIHCYDIDETRFLQKEGVLPTTDFMSNNEQEDEDNIVDFDFNEI